MAIRKLKYMIKISIFFLTSSKISLIEYFITSILKMWFLKSLKTKRFFCIHFSYGTYILPLLLALAFVSSRDSGDKIELVGDNRFEEWTLGILSMVEPAAAGELLPARFNDAGISRIMVGDGELTTGLGMSVGRLASTDSPGTWVSVGGGGLSNVGRVLRKVFK